MTNRSLNGSLKDVANAINRGCCRRPWLQRAGWILCLAVHALWPGITWAQNNKVSLLATFTNPTLANGDAFGSALAALGSDRVVIGDFSDNTGAENAGAAYLFGLNGRLLTTFKNPAPTKDDNFGDAVAVVGGDRVVIGAPGDDLSARDAGVAYLFNTNGVLLTTFRNPKPLVEDQFGTAVAPFGDDGVLITAPNAALGNRSTGVAYLFGLDGQLRSTFKNPTPGDSDQFGISIAAVGPDRVVIGAFLDNVSGSSAGRAYLFHTNGSLLTTFAHPKLASGDEFGVSVAAVGSDRVLIGAFTENTGAEDAGAAYLFNTDGTVLTVFTNPVPARNDVFGIRVAAVGSDQVVITASHDDAGEEDAGTAYLYSLDGRLLNTLNLPNPISGDRFGIAVTTVGRRLLIGSLGANEAYLFGIPISGPELTITHDHTNVSITWLNDVTGWVLQETDSLNSPPLWRNSAGPVIRNDITNVVRQPIGAGRFYRLQRP